MLLVTKKTTDVGLSFVMVKKLQHALQLCSDEKHVSLRSRPDAFSGAGVLRAELVVTVRLASRLTVSKPSRTLSPWHRPPGQVCCSAGACGRAGGVYSVVEGQVQDKSIQVRGSYKLTAA
jgi:hypothetical protein